MPELRFWMEWNFARNSANGADEAPTVSLVFCVPDRFEFRDLLEGQTCLLGFWVRFWVLWCNHSKPLVMCF